MIDKLDDLVERLPERPFIVVRTIQYWLLETFAPMKVCLYCVDCEVDNVPANNYEPCWYCNFRGDMSVDWQDTCRAFKRGKKTEEPK